MIQADYEFLPGVPSSLVLKRLNADGGNEVNSGKLSSPESSAALAVNTFGWFIEQPELLPTFPMLQSLNWPATQVEVEYCARFPWTGGKHPWLDAWVEQAAEKGFFTLVLGSGEAHFLVLSLFGIGIAVFVLPPRAV